MSNTPYEGLRAQDPALDPTLRPETTDTGHLPPRDTLDAPEGGLPWAGTGTPPASDIAGTTGGTTAGTHYGTTAGTTGDLPHDALVPDTMQHETEEVTSASGHAPSSGGSVSSTVESAKQSVGSATDQAKHEASAVKDTVVESSGRVASTAKDEAGRVVEEAKTQVQGLLDQGRTQVREQATSGKDRLTTTVRGWADELDALVRGEGTSDGPVSQVASDLTARGQGVASWLESHDLDDLVEEVSRFARRRPVAFLVAAAGLGVLAGRFARGMQGD